MKDYLIIPSRDIHPEYQQHCVQMDRLGLDPRGLLQYGLLYATHSYGGYHELQSYLVQDVVATSNDGRPDDVMRKVHACMDHIALVELHVVPHILRTCGFFDHTVRLEGFAGNDMLISLERPAPTTLSYVHDRNHPLAFGT